MSVSRTWLVTGANRGIGLSVVRQLLLAPENVVFAGCRNPSSAVALSELQKSHEIKGKLHVVQMDVTDEASVHRAKAEVEKILGNVGLDYLLNNAGVIVKDDAPSTLDFKDLEATMKVNVGGPILINKTFIPLVERGNRKVVASISTWLASMTIDSGTRYTSYSISKAALNMLICKQAKERPDLIPILVVPGWVRTDMGTEAAPLKPEESAAGIVKVLSKADQSYAGRFIDYKGEFTPW